MKTRGAVIHAIGEPWKLEELELEEPHEHEVRVRVMASGICHSDEHVVKGEIMNVLPQLGGHEGAGIVESVGSAVTRVKPGDHIATAYLPCCGVCDWCASGRQYICDNGAGMDQGRALDGHARFRLTDGREIGAMQRLGTFSNYLVTDDQQVVRIDDDIPFQAACLVACGATTGWGSSVNAGGVRPGDTVLVLGVGGVGMNAVQGAANAGAKAIFAIDTEPLKREVAPSFGATHAYATIAEAWPELAHLTNGQGADVSVVTVGRVTGELIAQAFNATSKGGTCVVTAVGENEPGIPISPWDLSVFQRKLVGCLFGNANPTRDIPRLLRYYKAGKLKLDELVTRTYRIDQVNEAFDDMRAARNIRGVILHEH